MKTPKRVQKHKPLPPLQQADEDHHRRFDVLLGDAIFSPPVKAKKKKK